MERLDSRFCDFSKECWSRLYSASVMGYWVRYLLFSFWAWRSLCGAGCFCRSYPWAPRWHSHIYLWVHCTQSPSRCTWSVVRFRRLRYSCGLLEVTGCGWYRSWGWSYTFQFISIGPWLCLLRWCWELYFLWACWMRTDVHGMLGMMKLLDGFDRCLHHRVLVMERSRADLLNIQERVLAHKIYLNPA